MKTFILSLYFFLIGYSSEVAASEELHFNSDLSQDSKAQAATVEKDKYVDPEAEQEEEFISFPSLTEESSSAQPIIGKDRAELLTEEVNSNYKVIILRNERFGEKLELSNHETHLLLSHRGLNALEPSYKRSQGEEDLSLLLYSPTANVSFFVAADVRPFLIFTKEFFVDSSTSNSEKSLVADFVKDLNITITKVCEERVCKELLNTQDYMKYLDLPKLAKLQKYEKKRIISPLAYLADIYHTHREQLDSIMLGIAKCEIDFHKHKNREVFNRECNKVYRQLVKEEFIKAILKTAYHRDLAAYIRIYYLILGWGDLTELISTTCLLGTQFNKSRSNSFYETFVFPFLDKLFMNLNGSYSNFTVFHYDSGPQSSPRKRMDIIQFRVRGDDKSINSNREPAIAIRGVGIPLNSQTGAVATKREGGGCLLM
ncbi:hypothetical protein [Candidatus Odyssella thessalonicensis]|uniref:hypothetical protein n=1 Tax=Candidatus Odyssella thessalonicensis TaxID=84647 RepID=UPI000225AC18|nr:hypothetical protein [Candidatus Odyssella thessalonicensis]